MFFIPSALFPTLGAGIAEKYSQSCFAAPSLQFQMVHRWAMLTATEDVIVHYIDVVEKSRRIFI